MGIHFDTPKFNLLAGLTLNAAHDTPGFNLQGTGDGPFRFGYASVSTDLHLGEAVTVSMGALIGQDAYMGANPGALCLLSSHPSTSPSPNCVNESQVRDNTSLYGMLYPFDLQIQATEALKFSLGYGAPPIGLYGIPAVQNPSLIHPHIFGTEPFSALRGAAAMTLGSHILTLGVAPFGFDRNAPTENFYNTPVAGYLGWQAHNTNTENTTTLGVAAQEGHSWRGYFNIYGTHHINAAFTLYWDLNAVYNTAPRMGQANLALGLFALIAYNNSSLIPNWPLRFTLGGDLTQDSFGRVTGTPMNTASVQFGAEVRHTIFTGHSWFAAPQCLFSYNQIPNSGTQDQNLFSCTLMTGIRTD